MDISTLQGGVMDPSGSFPLNSGEPPRNIESSHVEDKKNYFEKIKSTKDVKIHADPDKVETVRKTINENVRKTIPQLHLDEPRKSPRAMATPRTATSTPSTPRSESNQSTAPKTSRQGKMNLYEAKLEKEGDFRLSPRVMTATPSSEKDAGLLIEEARLKRLVVTESIETDLLADPSNEPVQDWDQIENELIDLAAESTSSTSSTSHQDKNFLDGKLSIIKSTSLINVRKREALIKTVSQKMIARSTKLTADLVNNPPNPLKYAESKSLEAMGSYHKELEAIFLNCLFSASNKTERDAVCNFFIKVASEAYKKNDFNTAFGIIVNFNHHFMDKFTGDLKSTNSKKFEMLKKLFIPNNAYRNYYSKIGELKKEKIPFLHSRNILMREMEFMIQPLASLKMNPPSEMEKEMKKNSLAILNLKSEGKEQEAEKLVERNSALEKEISTYDVKRAQIEKDIGIQFDTIMDSIVYGVSGLLRNDDISTSRTQKDALFIGNLAKPKTEDEIWDAYSANKNKV